MSVIPITCRLAIARQCLAWVSTPELVVANLPNELREYKQFLIWSYEIGEDGTLTKRLRRVIDPARFARSNDPSDYATFEDAIECWRKHPSFISGIGFAPSEHDPFVFGDVDAESRVAAEHLEERRALVGAFDQPGTLLHDFATYTELSPSGEGLRMIGRGRLPISGTKTKIKVEWFGHKGWVTLTGRVIEGRSTITDQQAYIDRVSPCPRPQSSLDDDGELRRVDLSDDLVLAKVFEREPNIEPIYHCHTEPENWSTAFYRLVAALDRVTGKIEQVKGLALASALVTKAPPKSRGGETRPEKARRIFDGAVTQARSENTATLISTRQGEAIVAGLAKPDLDPWVKPDISLLGSNRRPAPAFPLDVLGEDWARWVRVSAASTSGSVDYVAATLLAAVGGALANVRWPMVSATGWTESPLLWIGIVGHSSEVKTPAMRPPLNLLRKAEERMGEGFDQTLKEYEGSKLAAKVSRDLWQQVVEQNVKMGAILTPMPAEAVEPKMPVRPRIEVNDATTEKIASLASALPRGLLMHRDELAGWLEGLNKYNGGGDRQFFLEAYQGNRYTVDRVKHSTPLVIPHLSVGVLGGIQPDKLAKVIEGAEDGLIPRFLFAWPDTFPAFGFTRERAENDQAEWAFLRLVDLKMHEDRYGNLEPKHVHLTPAAEDALELFGQKMQRLGRGVEGQYANAIGKARGQALRLSGILEHLWWCVRGDREPLSISVEALNAAVRLVEFYFLPMAERVYGDVAMPVSERHAMVLARHLRKNRISKFNAREERKKIGGPLREAQVMDEACAALVEAGLIKEAFARAGNTQGRQAKSFDVNIKWVWEAR